MTHIKYFITGLLMISAFFGTVGLLFYLLYILPIIIVFVLPPLFIFSYNAGKNWHESTYEEVNESIAENE